MRCNSLRHCGIFVLVGAFLIALSLPRFGLLWHIHPGGEAAHIHDPHVLAHETPTPHTHHPDSYGHTHPHPHDHGHGHDHAHAVHEHDHPDDPEEEAEVHLRGATAHGLHAHYFNDSLPVGYCLLPLPMLIILAAARQSCSRESLPARHLSPPTARAPPA